MSVLLRLHGVRPTEVSARCSAVAELNALGGWRTTHVDVPTSTRTAATPLGRPSWYHGNEIPFDPTTFERLYGNVERWQRKVADRLEQYLREQTYLPVDAEELRR